MGCITSKAIARSMSIREELRQGFHSRSAAWEEILTSHSNSNLPSSTTDPPTNAETASHDVAQFRRSNSCDTLRDKDPVGKKRSLSFHTVEEYDDLLERIRLQEEGHVKIQQEPTCIAEDEEESCNVETGWKRKAVAKGLKSLDVELPGLRQQQAQIYSPGAYVTPKFGSYNVSIPEDETKQDADAVFSPELLAAFEDCMQQLQLEEDTILTHMDHCSSNMYKPIDS